MDTQSLAEEVLRIRRRLNEIQRERKRLPAEAFAQRTDLLDEEHQLRARLADIEEESGLQREKAAPLEEAPTLELPAIG